MKKKRKKFFSWHTLYVVILACIINAVIWIALHGCPLIGLPKKEDVKNITIICNGTEERQITSNEDIELLVNAANLLNYKLWGEKEDSPVIDITYHLKNGNNIHIAANSTTMWWNNKAHALKEPDTFIHIIQGLFFNF